MRRLSLPNKYNTPGLPEMVHFCTEITNHVLNHTRQSYDFFVTPRNMEMIEAVRSEVILKSK